MISLLSSQEVMFFCVREEPVVFLHLEENFVPYTPRRKENLHENLHGLDKEGMVENLELTIRKEVTWPPPTNKPRNLLFIYQYTGLLVLINP
jgi:hypothetical protein